MIKTICVPELANRTYLCDYKYFMNRDLTDTIHKYVIIHNDAYFNNLEEPCDAHLHPPFMIVPYIEGKILKDINIYPIENTVIEYDQDEVPILIRSFTYQMLYIALLNLNTKEI